jgi:hypothetical protein
VTIIELEKNLWERVDNVVRCGYSVCMETNTITKTKLNTTITHMRYLLQCVRSNKSTEEQIQLLRIIADAANSVANRLENK